MTKMSCCHYSLKKRENVQLVVLKVIKYNLDKKKKTNAFIERKFSSNLNKADSHKSRAYSTVGNKLYKQQITCGTCLKNNTSRTASWLADDAGILLQKDNLLRHGEGALGSYQNTNMVRMTPKLT